MRVAGAFAIYLEPWHADIFDWLDLRKNHGKVDYVMLIIQICLPMEYLD